MTDVKLLVLLSNTWNNLTVCKQMNSGLFKMLPTIYSFTTHTYLIYKFKPDLALNNLQRLICHKKKQPTNADCISDKG